MASVNIYEAKTQLSRLLRRVRSGEDIVISDNGRPVARLVPIEPEGGRRLGGDEGAVFIADDFDAPLPDDAVDVFSGGAAAARPVEKKARAKRTRKR